MPRHPLRLIIALTCLCLLLRSAAIAQVSDCPQSASHDLTSAAPEQVGMRSGQLADAVRSLRGTDRDIHALVIVRHCKVVIELYAKDVTREHNHALYSVTKSVLATLVGVLVKSGRLPSLDVPVADLLGSTTTLNADQLDKARRIRLRHVMSMASGLEYQENPAVHPIYGVADRLQFALSPAFITAPGQRYNYSNGDASIVDAVATAAAGEDLLSYGRKALFEPLGFKNVEWSFRDKAGRYPGGWGLRLRAIDMAKFGQLYLQKGRWQGVNIIAPAFIDEAWKPSPAASFYGLFWWRWSKQDPRVGPLHYADGYKGQRIFVLPKHGIVIAVTGNVALVDAEKAYPALIRAVVSSVQSNRPISSSETETARLAEQLRLPFTGTPGNPLSKTGQDVPRIPK